ncbi:MAG TPA: PqiC family protein [Oceanipulchritudo sp.]|nr:PqiC family protein [Oceanipulchritudo sp.]
MNIQKFTTISLIPCLLLAMAGCADLEVFKPRPDESKFYFLENDSVSSSISSLSSEGLAVLVGPSSVAKYLDQPQIVTFDGANQLNYSDGNRWGEPLEESINRLLIYQIAGDLATSRVGNMRFMGDFDWEYKVGYHIYQLGGHLGGRVQMKISWWIISKDGQTSHYDGNVYEQPVAGNGSNYTAYVQAIEAIVEAWSVDVSKALVDLTGN